MLTTHAEKEPEIRMSCSVTLERYVGEHVEITCNVIAIPAAQITWQFDDKNLTSAEYKHTHKIDSLSCKQRLQIHTAMREDSGVYTCMASNSYGTVNKTCRLIIKSESAQIRVQFRKT